MLHNNPTVVNLCVLSQAEGGVYVDRRGLNGGDCRHQACPLRLGRAEAKGWPCKNWEKVGDVQQEGRGQPVRVLACLFPETWNGDTIRNPETFAAYIHKKQQA
jgi:hypothetical protein